MAITRSQVFWSLFYGSPKQPNQIISFKDTSHSMEQVLKDFRSSKNKYLVSWLGSALQVKCRKKKFLLSAKLYPYTEIAHR